MTIWNVCVDQIPDTDDKLILTIDEGLLTLPRAVEACQVITDTKRNKDNTALCFKKNVGISDELQLVFMAMVVKGFLSIMEVEDLMDVDEEYANAVFEYTVSVDELGYVLGEELGKFAELSLTDTTNPINSLVNHLIETTIYNIQSSPSTENEVLSAESVELRERLAEAEEQIETLTNLKQTAVDRVAQLSNKLEQSNKCVNEQALMIKTQKLDISDLTTKLEATTEKLDSFVKNAGGQVQSATYIETNVDRLKGKMVNARARIDVDHVLYFKELTACTYINSFIVNFIQYIKNTKRRTVICLIYDRAEFNRYKYGKLKLLNGANFQAGQSLKDQDIVVVTDAAPQILEDALITNSIVIVYDRLGADKDIVVGRNVHKFAVVNSQKELIEVKRATGLTNEQFITTFGTDRNSISVRQVREYKQMSNGGKIMSYANMVCTKNNTDTIYERLLFTANMNLDGNNLV